MSASLKLAAKKKYTQHDLRRLMQEQKAKASTSTATNQADKINSPLAKYENGKLMCIICKNIVRSESVWKVHLNTKIHKENVLLAKQLNEKLQQSSKNYTLTTGQKRTFSSTTPSSHLTNSNTQVVPEKKLKSILRKPPDTTPIKKAEPEDKKSNENGQIPADFFDSKSGGGSSFFETTLSKTSIKAGLVNINRKDINIETDQDNKMEVEEKDEAIPEGFFDDPIKDAKIRNLEYKDPHEEEWEKFQREIKEEASLSNAIIAGEQDTATNERQIEEIDEQIQKWSRVLALEKLKDVVSNKVKERLSAMEDEQSNDSISDEEMNFDEFLDWRSKKFHK